MNDTAGQRVKRVARWVGPVALVAIGMTPALAQARGPVVVAGASISPIVALIAGILILILPRLLNYIVAIYLIVVGLVGLMAR